jgi:CBS domain-containing protein
MNVRDIMTPNPASCTPEDPAQRAALVMRNLDVGAVPIVNNEMDRRPVGIVTDPTSARAWSPTAWTRPRRGSAST